MPLPKLPTRPAAILNFPSGETLTLDSQQTDESAARRPSGRKTVTDQPIRFSPSWPAWPPAPARALHAPANDPAKR